MGTPHPIFKMKNLSPKKTSSFLKYRAKGQMQKSLTSELTLLAMSPCCLYPVGNGGLSISHACDLDVLWLGTPLVLQLYVYMFHQVHLLVHDLTCSIMGDPKGLKPQSLAHSPGHLLSPVWFYPVLGPESTGSVFTNTQRLCVTFVLTERLCANRIVSSWAF